MTAGIYHEFLTVERIKGRFDNLLLIYLFLIFYLGTYLCIVMVCKWLLQVTFGLSEIANFSNFFLILQIANSSHFLN